MITVKFGQKMSMEELNGELDAIDKTENPLVYEVTEIDLNDIVNMGGIDGMNVMLVDNVINNGYLLGDVRYKVGSMIDGKVSIIVSCYDHSEFIEEHDRVC